LLQYREDRTDIDDPNGWIFGGALAGESAEQALRREMIEELGLHIGGFSLLFICTFDLRFAALRVRKTFFDVEITRPEAEKLTLKEGQGMAWLRFDEVVARAEHIVPYDLGALALHLAHIRPPSQASIAAGGFTLPARAEQTQRASPGGEEREGGGERCGPYRASARPEKSHAQEM
jgi:ADP-ribose pyrophosphatase YjhB (NUDIX family)